MRHSNTIILNIAMILPACTYQQVSFEKDITPIIDRNCSGCHREPNGYGYRATGLKMDSYDSIIQGSIYGSIIVAGDSRRSILNKMVEGRTGKKKCDSNDGKEGISNKEIEILKVWVDQGALNN